MPSENSATRPPVAYNRTAPDSSSLTRRIAAVIVSIWFGGILLVALGAPAAFRSVDSVLSAPPKSVAKAVETLGPSLTREILRYQVGEANRMLFDVWGWVQVSLALAVVILLLFFSSVGRAQLGLSLGMLFLAGLMNFVLIPRMTEIGRQMRAALQVQPADLAEKFRLMHLGFSAFELAVVALGAMLLVLLLRDRNRTGHNRRRVEQT